MVERVARAIVETYNDYAVRLPGFVKIPFEKLEGQMQANALACARAAISTLREPTDAMTEAGSESGITETDAHAVWWRMIGEALKP